MNVLIDSAMKELQPVACQILDEQIHAAILKNNPKKIEFAVDSNGVIIDKEKHPDVYDWAVNG